MIYTHDVYNMINIVFMIIMLHMVSSIKIIQEKDGPW